MSAAPDPARPPGPTGTVGAIWAQTAGGVIGRGGTMPWSLPEDMAFFRRTTTGHPVIMGRRTWESFPERFRPLPARTNIVITSSPDRVAPGAGPGAVLTAASYAEAVRLARSSPGAERIWVIGGGEVYRQALADAEHPVTEALVTVIDLDAEGDTHAPVLDGTWATEPVVGPSVSRTGLGYRIDRRTRGPHGDGAGVRGSGGPAAPVA
ncbi:dihydrofolate reductase [Kocuria rosea subsp. polaris]|uniref:dihydrofolate reductase n=1 Tax=Kocuria rosea subsp. polaris TaxID=136273 RepID=A0A0W8IPW5_KOCRO|nr:dihydrofolate reductase [Kocuria polaris]KUG62113.1 dihydrofolate reductase [Kocuria polaris]